jgi:hypothetical protein
MVESSPQTQDRRPVWVALLIAALVVASIAAGIIGFGVRVMLNPTSTHEAAVARWEASGSNTYTITVQVREPLREDIIYEIVVADGEIAEAALINAGAFRFDPNPTRFEADPAQATPYTVNGMFNRAERLTDDLRAIHVHLPATSHVRYDRATGHPTRIVQNRCGILVNAVDACVTSVEVISLRLGPGPER